jgi:hypothetical protein
MSWTLQSASVVPFLISRVLYLSGCRSAGMPLAASYLALRVSTVSVLDRLWRPWMAPTKHVSTRTNPVTNKLEKKRRAQVVSISFDAQAKSRAR